MRHRCIRIVGEIKYVGELKPRHIKETVRKYHWPFVPTEYEMVIPRHTKVSRETRELAAKKRVRIRRCRDFE
jgi:hypothetical protein